MKHPITETEEADITINGITLSYAQSMSVRVAVTNFLHDLANPEQRKLLGTIGDLYAARLREVEKMIVGDL